MLHALAEEDSLTWSAWELLIVGGFALLALILLGATIGIVLTKLERRSGKW
ncbi:MULTISPECIES: hypothetical protein [unclassified Nonomuraea]|uniref:hypothetical protein n=1 Tax=unclassified Nonomuraea TaxID=2593643 RepID=UPI0033C36ACD